MNVRGKTIVLADDDPDLLQVLSSRCTQLGMHVHTTEDAMTALSTVDFLVPDVVCLDIEMPNGNGLAACEMISDDHRFAEIPMIILTGKTDEATITRCRNMRAHYIAKGADVWPRLRKVLVEVLSGGAESAGEKVAHELPVPG